MVASLKFESAAGTAAATLAEVKLVTLADNTDNKYTLDIITDDLKVAYTPNGGQAKEYTVNGLAAALGKLLTIDGSTPGKSVLAEEVAKQPVVDALIPELAKDDGTTGIYTKKGVDDELAKKADTTAIPAAPDLSNYLETSKLAEEVVKKPVVEAIFDAKDGNDKISETKIGATFAKKTDLNNKVNVLGDNATEAGVNAMLGKLTGDNVVVKINASNLTDAANQKAFAEAILPAKNGNKLVLVEKLGEFLGSKETAPYDGTNNQTAKVFLAEKGLKPTPQEVATELMKNPDFAQAATIEADANDKGFQGAVRGVMSQPYFDIPTDDSTPISMVW